MLNEADLTALAITLKLALVSTVVVIAGRHAAGLVAGTDTLALSSSSRKRSLRCRWCCRQRCWASTC